MRVADFDYDLPDELIARFPTSVRSGSRLLVLDGRDGSLGQRHFTDIVELLNPGDLLVFNDTRVIPARLFGRKESGGEVEILVERVLDDARTVLAHVRASKSPKPGSRIIASDGTPMEMRERRDALFLLALPNEIPGDFFSLLDRAGHMPLPPYMQRDDNATDRERYQTIFAQHPGAVAAPTAGLHFDAALMQALKEKGVNTAAVTLHVGAGTFQPVRVENVAEHHMHGEIVDVGEATVAAIHATRAAGKRVVAVGTTSVRSLESAARSGELRAFHDETDIFIFPGRQFRVVDALITNFHLPRSTLLMLVSAFAGMENTLQAYRAAVQAQYRFFSYGDAMFIPFPAPGARSDT